MDNYENGNQENNKNRNDNGASAHTENKSFYTYGSPYENDTYNTHYSPCDQPKKKKRGNGFGAKLARCTAIALVFGLVAGTAFTGTSYFFRNVMRNQEGSDWSEEVGSGADLNIVPGTTEEASSSDADMKGSGTVTSVSAIVNQAMPSIVSITTMGVTEVRNFFGQTQQYESESCGSGIIISQDDDNLYIVTNNHVVAAADTLTVTFDDNTTVSAQVKGTDASTDLAVISIPMSSLESDTVEAIRTATFGDSESLKVGESAVAIGNALGYGQSVTTGVISAVNREVTVADESTGGSTTNELLQTDAAINPGNSGGALLNLNGEVIGINSVKYSDTSVEGMGYAIPVSSAIPIIKQLISREEVASSESAYLGISGVDVTSTVASTYNMPKGVYVARVMEGAAAAKAGITQGDIITKFDGRGIASMEEMQEQMKYYKAGTTVELTIQRTVNGQYEESAVNITLGSKN